jgi:4,5-DOPA dioxygenase extradiol
VNTDKTNPLIYDFYNFPKHFYEQTFESHGDEGIVGDVKAALEGSGVGVTEEMRGLDHGIWGKCGWKLTDWSEAGLK